MTEQTPVADGDQTEPHTDQTTDDGARDHGSDAADAGGTPSEGGSGFASAETSEGGADASPGTPDGVPQGNRDENDHLPEEGLRS